MYWWSCDAPLWITTWETTVIHIVIYTLQPWKSTVLVLYRIHRTTQHVLLCMLEVGLSCGYFCFYCSYMCICNITTVGTPPDQNCPKWKYITNIRNRAYWKSKRLSNICLNLFNLTFPGNYSLRHYCSIFIGSHLLHLLVPKSFVFLSDFRHQQVNNQTFFPSLPLPNSWRLGLQF